MSDKAEMERFIEFANTYTEHWSITDLIEWAATTLQEQAAEIARLQALADERGRRISIIDLHMGKDNKRNLCADYPEATKWFDAEGNAK